MNHKKITLISVSLLVSNVAIASDPTPLFVMFIAFPLIALAILFFILCVFKPKFGMILSVLLILAHLVVMSWATDVGYMDSAGSWVIASFFINIGAITVAGLKINKKQKNEINT